MIEFYFLGDMGSGNKEQYDISRAMKRMMVKKKKKPFI